MKGALCGVNENGGRPGAVQVQALSGAGVVADGAAAAVDAGAAGADGVGAAGADGVGAVSDGDGDDCDVLLSPE
jgi:hypothetical protein